MTRGFITIAAGQERYYELAENLLHSYKLNCNTPMPFAILCDRENAHTALFDQVILLEKPLYSFWDKFQLLKLAPYEETIFLDADCLAYGDLNTYWEYFANGDDFTGSGTNYPIESNKGLFFQGHLGPYEGRVHWKPDIMGGLYFIRKGDTCNRLYDECQKICQIYDSFPWPDYCAPYGDEMVLCLAMAALGLRATDADPKNYGIPWEATYMKHDILTGLCQYSTDWHPLVEHGLLIHFGTVNCAKPAYIADAEKIRLMLRYGLRPKEKIAKLTLKDTILYRWHFRYFWLVFLDIAQRACRKLYRIIVKKAY